MSVCALIVAAGSGKRAGLGENKVLAPLGGRPVLCHTVEAFRAHADAIVVVVRAEDEARVAVLGLPARLAVGGVTRQQSVLAGLALIASDADIVLVHDAARPFVPEETIKACVESARKRGSGVACLPVTDTIKRAADDNTVIDTIPRDRLRAVQTPQAFRAGALRRALEALEAQGLTATDDAGAMEAAGEKVFLVPGSERNIKLTTRGDFEMAARWIGHVTPETAIRVGHGYDAHRLGPDRALRLCGVDVPHEKGLIGHSDADVALHALMDALLGAAALGDIGGHFPPGDPRYLNISSLTLLCRVAALLAERGLAARNVDLTILAERPRLKPYIPEMVAAVADALNLPADRVSVKATTTEGMGFEGEGLGISAHAVAMVGEKT